MDINDWIKILEDSKGELGHILNECKDGPAELALLASKMEPLLEEFSTIEKELHASAILPVSSPNASTEADPSSEDTQE